MIILDSFRRRKGEQTSPESQDLSSDQSRADAENRAGADNTTHTGDRRGRAAVIRHRIFYSIIYLIALIFIILVIIGSTSDRAVIGQTYFIKIDLSNVIPRSVPDAVLINSIARTIGLHDFYQVGLWNFCEGYADGTGITHCSEPKKLYYFNPVDILMSELLSGATIALPSDIDKILNIIRTVSAWMFSLFIVSAVLIFLCIFLTPLSVPSSLTPYTSKHRAVSKRLFIPLTLFAFLTFFVTIAASVLATAMFTVFKIVFSSNAVEFNIDAELGTRMLAFMWIAVGFVLFGLFLHVRSILWWCCCCCCRRRSRDPSPGEKNVGNGADGNGQEGSGGGEKEKMSRWRRMRGNA
ncbi:hypothetical protein AJ79_08454 [Helicocarpus griseus UAMH5409]|uniref:Integral membrane protein n=1 Tax=Helicocarpus griseus UAMH5409 TaxID=1447875 RepID=A0A2B7WT84_9EURO|nr:hypothetical protein AJ79_08454 [Helicocarpus griseus UAMH5409]